MPILANPIGANGVGANIVSASPVSSVIGGFGVEKIVLLGASITNQSFNDSSIPMIEGYIKNKYGKDVTIDDQAVSGTDVADLRASIDATLANYAGEQGSTVFYMHIGGGDISIGVPFLDTGLPNQQQKIDDLNYIYDQIINSGFIVVQAALTFRNYNGNTIDLDPDNKINELGGSYTYTRDWIAPIIKQRFPQFVDDEGWPVIDQYNATRNAYENWRDPDDLSDEVHPNKWGHIVYFAEAIDGVMQLSEGQIPAKVTKRNFNDALPQGGSFGAVFGFGRTTEIGGTDDNINWTARPRPIPLGEEVVFVQDAKDTTGSTLLGVNLYTWFDTTFRRGAGNTADPTNSTASLDNNVLLESGLSVNVGSGSNYMIIEGLEPMSLYEVGFAAGVQNSATAYNVRGWAFYGDNVPLTYIANDLNPQTQTVYKQAQTDYKGRILIACSEENNLNASLISGIQITNL